jgi:hypothetical protein
MRNIAKCKLCGSIIESYAMQDYVECSCGEIAIDGGTYRLMTFARNYDNFLRLDDSGQEFPVNYENNKKNDGTEQAGESNPKIITQQQLIDELDQMIKNFDNIPPHAAISPVNHYDLVSVMLIISKFLRLQSDEAT